MNPRVVDSSVAVKWCVAEALAAEAGRVQAGPDPLHAPEFLDVEVANILWKKVRKGDITRVDADDILVHLATVAPVAREPDANLNAAAFDLAVQTGRTVYDCLYLALAVQLNGRMVTADDRLRTPSPAPPGPPTSSASPMSPDPPGPGPPGSGRTGRAEFAQCSRHPG